MQKKPILILSILAGLFAVGVGIYFIASLYKKDTLILLYGNIDIREVNLGFRVFGRVEKIFYEEGDRVKKGDLLATLDEKPYLDDVTAAKADLEEARIAHQNAEKIYQRKKSLLKQNFTSSQDFEDAESRRDELKAHLLATQAKLQGVQTRLDDTKVFAPSAGIILTRVKEPGSIVNPGESIYVLSLDAPIWVRAYIAETDLGRIHPGMKAKIYTDSRPHKPYTGHVGFISPVAEFTPKSVETTELRTKLVYRLRIIISDVDLYLRQGMPVTIKIEAPARA